jgi:transcriptional regulator with AAA-type ATPase domain
MCGWSRRAIVTCLPKSPPAVFATTSITGLNIVEIRLPTLAQRREDIPYLTAAFVRGFSQRFNKPLVGLTPGAERLLSEATGTAMSASFAT